MLLEFNLALNSRYLISVQNYGTFNWKSCIEIGRANVCYKPPMFSSERLALLICLWHCAWSTKLLVYKLSVYETISFQNYWSKKLVVHNCWSTKLLVYKILLYKYCSTKLLVYKTVDLQNCWCTKPLVYETVCLRNCTSTRLNFYKTIGRQNC